MCTAMQVLRRPREDIKLPEAGATGVVSVHVVLGAKLRSSQGRKRFEHYAISPAPSCLLSIRVCLNNSHPK